MSLETESLSGVAIVRVGDSGCGISEADRGRVFDKLYRRESSRSSEGNGLGLSIVKAIVEAHGGVVALKDNSLGLLVDVRFEKLSEH